MAFRRVSSLRFFLLSTHSHRYTRPRYTLHFPSIQLFPFSTIDNQSNPTKNNRREIDEISVLSELSDLLPLRTSSPQKPLEISKSVSEVFLPPEDRLRGVFLQKLRGKTVTERALSSVNVELGIEVLARVVNWGNLDGEKMVTFFNWAVKKDPKRVPRDLNTYHIILRALGRRKFLPQLVEILTQMKVEKIGTDLETLEIVTDSFLRARRVSEAVRMARTISENHLDKTHLNVVLECLIRRAHVGVAESVLNSMRSKSGAKIDIDSYNVVVKGWSRLGRVKEIERVIENMARDGVDPDGLTFCHVIEGLGRAGRAHEGVEIFEAMREKGFDSNAGLYNSVISNLVFVGNFEECLKYYKEMLDREIFDKDVFVNLINGFFRARRVADGLEVFDEMIERGFLPSTGVITSFLERLCGFGPPHAAMMVYKRAKKVGCIVSIRAYKLLLSRLARFGKCGTVLSVWTEMQQSGYFSDVEIYEFVVEGLCNNGQIENAVLVMEECLRMGFCPSRVIFGKLSRKLFESNREERAYRLFLKVKEARLSENARSYWRSKGWHF